MEVYAMMRIKKVLLFIGLAMAGIFLTLVIADPGFPYAITKDNAKDYNKWYRLQEMNEMGVINRYVFIVNEDKMMLYFSSMESGKIIAVGFKNSDSIFGEKPPMYKSKLCCWKNVDFIYKEKEGRILLQKQDWIWAVGENQHIQTSIMKDVMENNEVKFQYYLIDGSSKETQFKFDASNLLKQLRWLVNDPNLRLE